MFAVAAIGGGCGGGGEGSTASAEHTFTVGASTTAATGPRVTKAQFIAQANRICRQNWGNVYGNFNQYTGWHSKELHGNRLFALGIESSFLPSFDFEIFDRLHVTKVPPAEKAHVEEVMSAMQTAVEQGERHFVHVTSPPQLAALFADYNRAAKSYGLVDCLVDAARVRRAQA